MADFPTNDEYFDPKAQLLILTEEQAVEYARNFFDQNCELQDAAYLKEVITAGPDSIEATYTHAVRGSAVAQAVFGTNKLHGTHVAQCTSEGLFWLLRACNNGNSNAALVLAATYIEGEHVKRNTMRAYEYASVAAGRGLPAGQFVLANLLVEGGEIPEDQERAIELLQAAARSGYAPAIRMLDDNGIAVVSASSNGGNFPMARTGGPE